MNNYVFYITNKQKFVDLARQSAKSVKEHCSVRIESVLFTVGSEIGNPSGFDLCVNIPEITGIGWWQQQTQATLQALEYFNPTDQLIYMDCDTLAIGDVAPLFALLEVAEFAGAHSPRRYTSNIEHANIPRSFAEYNIGVNVMLASENVHRLWVQAAAYFNIMGDEGYDDQMALQEALWWMLKYNPRFRCITFPSEWNCRFNFPGSAGKEVIVLHGASDNMDAAIAKVNGASNAIRSWQ